MPFWYIFIVCFCFFWFSNILQTYEWCKTGVSHHLRQYIKMHFDVCKSKQKSDIKYRPWGCIKKRSNLFWKDRFGILKRLDFFSTRRREISTRRREISTRRREISTRRREISTRRRKIFKRLKRGFFYRISISADRLHLHRTIG